MSAERLRLIQLNQFIIEKIKAARNLANIMYRKTPDNSSQEPYLSVISDLLDESADMLYDQIDCLPPAVESTDKFITIIPAPVAIAPAKPTRKTTWTEEKKQAQSEKLKARWAAKKGAVIHHD